MANLDFPYKTVFAAQIRAIEPSESDIKEAKASLTDLKGLLPAGVDPEKDPQLLYIAANLYVAGMVNMNDDGVDIETSLAAYKGFEKQQLNIEHDRKRIAGYILHAGLSEFGTDRLITPDEAHATGKPFNVAVIACLWKVANKELCDYLAEASSPLHPEYKNLSLSFEVGFSSYNIGVIDAKSRVISEAKKIYVPSDVEFDAMSKRLRANGGSGRLTVDGSDGVYQILSGTFIPLGGGIVTMPAAAVKGITTVTEIPNGEQDKDLVAETKEDSIVVPINEDFDKQQQKILADHEMMEDLKSSLTRVLGLFNKNSLSRIISTKTSVSPYTLQTTTHSNMKSLKEVQEKMASVQKPEEYKEIVASIIEIAEALSAASEKMATELEAEKNRSAEIEKNRVAAEKANEDLKKEFASVQAEIDLLKSAQQATEAEATFNERMAAFDEIFDLDDESRAFFAAIAKKSDMSDDDDDDDVKNEKDDKKKKNMRFQKKVAKFKKLMPEKTKEFKKKLLDDKKKKADEMYAALKAKGIEVTLDEDNLIKEVIASAQANNVSPGISNTIDATKSLKDLVRDEFAESVTIGGKKISELKQKE